MTAAMPVARELLNRMIGQMLLIGFDGTSMTDPNMVTLLQEIAAGRIGGLIFFQRNIQSLPQLRHLLSAFKTIPVRAPLLLAVDQEGGTVQRISAAMGGPDVPSAKRMAQITSPAIAQRWYAALAACLKTLGFNVDLAPVVDVDVNPQSPAIGRRERSYSNNPAVVTGYAQAFLNALRQYGILSCLKHYPGHGSATADSHQGVTDITRTWRPLEQLPFQWLARTGQAPMVMVGHLFNANVDNRYPASLSQAHIQGHLRQELGYSGVVISDDLNMAAIQNQYSLEETILQAIRAGNDILLFAHPFNGAQCPQTVQEIVLRGIQEGRISLEQLMRSYQRILALKNTLKTNIPFPYASLQKSA
jgi:beta-N-acetylhexosaminidase